MIHRIAAIIIGLILLCALGELVGRGLTGGRRPAQDAAAVPVPASPFIGSAPPAAPAEPPPAEPSTSAPASCSFSAAFAGAAALNAASLDTAPVAPFGRPELGWEVYLPLTAQEIGTSCPPQAPGFAQALAGWQGAHHLAATGAMDAPTLDALRLVWLRRRPFVAATAHGQCPPGLPPDRLALALPQERYGAQQLIQLRPAALNAYRAMVSAARREAPDLAAAPRLLTIFSGYRDPLADGLRCVLKGDCGGAARANCSAHRTGLAVDLYMGSAPGYPPDSSADPNRLYLSRSVAYRWMVANAGRFGFVNYPFEPWHWEWTGEAP